MNDDTKYPESDRDLRLALLIGDRLEQSRREGADPASQGDPARKGDPGRHSSEGDAFLETLTTFRRQLSARRDAPSDEASRRMWGRIEDATRMPLRRVGRPDRGLRIVRPKTWIGIAAAVLIAAVVTLLLLQGPDATLVASSENEVVEYTAADGSVVMLRPRSELYLVDTEGQSVRYRIRGEAFFTVTARSAGVFSVEAGEGIIDVLGTRFNVSTWGSAASVYLEDGRVRFAHRSTDSEVILEPGQWSSIAEAGRPTSPVGRPSEEHLDWLAGELVFEQRPVSLIAAELEHHFGLSLEFDRQVSRETLTGRIPLDDERQSLLDLGHALAGRFVESGPRTYRFQPE